MIFGKDSNTDNAFSKTMKKVAWVILSYNCFTVFPYFYDAIPNADMLQRLFGSASVTSLMMSIEFATLTAIFNPRILAAILDSPKTQNDTNKQIASIARKVGLIAFLAISAYTFWFDYRINLSQIGAGNVVFLKVLAGVFVCGSEIAFACSNIFQLSIQHNQVNSSRKD
jgi:hypothetical protein